MKRIHLILLSAIALTVVLASCNKEVHYNNAEEMVAEAQKKIQEIKPEEFKAMMDSGAYYLLIDVRTSSEHNHGFIPGSVNIPRGSLEFKINDEKFWEDAFLYPPEKNDLIIVYCKKGHRGTLSAETLGKLGFTNVKNLEGGWKNWELTYPLIYDKNLEAEGGHQAAESGGC